MNELWIPILGVICAVGMPVLLGIIASYMTIKSKHEEKMAMIEKGIVLEEAMRPERRPNRYNTLRNGIFMIGLSLGVIVGMMLDSAFTYDSDWFFLLVPAITIMFGGVAFIIYFFLSRSLMEKEIFAVDISQEVFCTFRKVENGLQVDDFGTGFCYCRERLCQ